VVTLLVARHEFLMHLRRRSFVLSTALVPLLGLSASLVVGLGGADLVGQLGSSEPGQLAREGYSGRIGYVDRGGFVASLPADGAEGTFRAYPDEAAARQALRGREVDVVYVLSSDYPADRRVVRIAPGMTFAADDGRALEHLLRHNLWPEGSESLLADLAQPMRRVVVERDAGPEAVRSGLLELGPRRMLVPVIIAAFLYSTIFMLSSFLLQSVTTEKENRVVEILLTSLPPFQLLTGKVLGLGLLGLLQLAVWSLSGLFVWHSDARAILGLAALNLGWRVALLALTYFLLGFLFYASLMASIGALVPSFQESGPLAFVVLAPAWMPFVILQTLLREPDGWLARLLSLLPPTAPLVMTMRVLSGGVPPGEILLGFLIFVAGAVLVLWLAARLFRANLLLSGDAVGLRSLWSALSS